MKTTILVAATLGSCRFRKRPEQPRGFRKGHCSRCRNLASANRAQMLGSKTRISALPPIQPGRLLIDPVPVGNYTLVVSYIGYESVAQNRCYR